VTFSPCSQITNHKSQIVFVLAIAFCTLAVCASRAQDARGPDAEEAADFARRAAFAAVRGPQKIFLESIDADGILSRLIGGAIWGQLTERQQALLRSELREHFAQALAPVSGSTAEVAWASVASGAGPLMRVDLGLRYGAELLKTRWSVRRTSRGWTVEDIALVDPGLSLADQMRLVLGPRAVEPRTSLAQVRAHALPRLLGLAAIAALVLIVMRRLPRDRRLLLWLTAAVPALLFAVDGWLAVRRASAERYVLAEALPQRPWRALESTALEAQREGLSEQARDAWTRALEAGAPRAPVYYQMGLAARSRGDLAEARADFENALRERPPAPGAAKEMASIALGERRDVDARAWLERYLTEAGPDPDTLATLAVIQTNLQDGAAAVAAIQSARTLVGPDGQRAELEAQVYARTGNAGAAVEALRPLAAEGRVDRAALRADPAYLPIATDDAWVAFLAETPAVPPRTSTSGAPPRRP